MRHYIFVFLVLCASPLWACPNMPEPAGLRAAVDLEQPNQALLSAAVIWHVNTLRCRVGSKRLSDSPGLSAVAAIHSDAQAGSGVLSHNSDVRGQSSLRSRLRKSGESYFQGAENVGYVRGCGRNYHDLARAMVNWWADSPPHNANMLNKAFNRAGAGVAFANGCARAYLTLDFVG